jgi:stigma-specific protein Stig1
VGQARRSYAVAAQRKLVGVALVASAWRRRLMFALALSIWAVAAGCNAMLGLDDPTVVCDALADCSGACVDLATDPRHCGQCGRDCQGASCSDGICAPVQLASGFKNPHGLALDGDDLYWTTYGDNVVESLPLEGAATATLATGQQLPAVLGVSATHLYWTSWDSGAVRRVPLGGGGSVEIIDASTSAPFGLALDAGRVYWAGNGDGTIRSAPRGGGTVTSLASGQSHPVCVAVDANNVYWTDLGDGAVRSVGLARGSVVQTLVSGQTHPWGLAIDGTSA